MKTKNDRDQVEAAAGRVFPAALLCRSWNIAFRCAAAGLAALLPALAQASPVTVTPTLVSLGPGHSTALITIINEGDDPARFETSLNAWSESPDGFTMLSPNGDVVVFPQLIALAPHETKKIRVGTEQVPGTAERSYRLIMQELPQLDRDAGQVQIQVLTKISLPVFLTPRGAAPRAAIEMPGLRDGQFSFDVVNAGSAHFVLHQVNVTGHGAGGDSFALSTNGWYVLAGGRRTFHVALSAADCRKTTEIVLKTAGDTAPAEIHVPINANACGGGNADSHFLKADSPAPE